MVLEELMINYAVPRLQFSQDSEELWASHMNYDPLAKAEVGPVAHAYIIPMLKSQHLGGRGENPSVLITVRLNNVVLAILEAAT